MQLYIRTVVGEIKGIIKQVTRGMISAIYGIVHVLTYKHKIETSSLGNLKEKIRGPLSPS